MRTCRVLVGPDIRGEELGGVARSGDIADGGAVERGDIVDGMMLE